MFISHDLSVVKFISDRILVMNRGQIVEEGSSESIYREPQQYTRQLIASIPTGSLERIQQRQALQAISQLAAVLLSCFLGWPLRQLSVVGWC